ncbi:MULTISPECIES: hypothetical protein [Sphingobacterium]|uniref:hypothetical protein n=1 Tax=Sphingobacterium TaxID=28453 RepID=UPI00038A372A|nr:hypothetical protein [Sphingobacterium sp. IITKGP-BTPF85]KKX49493.1 hypothetical protein L950_0215365 [Sphingobacterium sp. IITKGP-BTPF85]
MAPWPAVVEQTIQNLNTTIGHLNDTIGRLLKENHLLKDRKKNSGNSSVGIL